jgi:hypothetical protein
MVGGGGWRIVGDDGSEVRGEREGEGKEGCM